MKEPKITTEEKKAKEKAESKKQRKRAMLKCSTLVLSAAVAVATSGLVKEKAPSDDELAAAVNPPYVIEETVDLPPEPAAPDEEPEKEKVKKKSAPSAGSTAIYIAGWILSSVLMLLKGVLGLVPARAAGVAVFIAGIILALVFALKKAFPNLTLSDIKKLIPGKAVILGLLSIGAVCAYCELMVHYRSETPFIYAVYLLGGLLIILEVYSFCVDKITAEAP